MGDVESEARAGKLPDFRASLAALAGAVGIAACRGAVLRFTDDQLGSVPARPSRRAVHRLGGGYACRGPAILRTALDPLRSHDQPLPLAARRRRSGRQAAQLRLRPLPAVPALAGRARTPVQARGAAGWARRPGRLPRDASSRFKPSGDTWRSTTSASGGAGDLSRSAIWARCLLVYVSGPPQALLALRAPGSAGRRRIYTFAVLADPAQPLLRGRRAAHVLRASWHGGAGRARHAERAAVGQPGCARASWPAWRSARSSAPC